MINIIELFDIYSNNDIDFPSLKNKPNNRPDLCAMILLDKLVPSSGYMISDADHDVIYFDINVDELSQKASEEDILMLVGCGVQCDDDGLFMYV